MTPGPAAAAEQPVFEGPVPRAACGPGSAPEPKSALQGEVTVADRDSGRATDGYRCNMELVGNYPGEGAEWQHTYYGDCAYYDTRFSGTQQSRGTQVLDVSDPSAPKLATNLTTVAMLDPWESLSVNQKRGLLGGVAVTDLQGGAFFDVYDVGRDCRKPRLVASLPVSGLNHEGDWAFDGMTYYATGIRPGTVTAIDVSNPAAPAPITTFYVSSSIHGLSTSEDGNRLYVADISGQGGGNGLTIVDVSEIQARAPLPEARVVGAVGWSDGSTAQHTIPVTIGGRPHVVFVDELGAGAARIIDIADEKKPRVISKLKLEIHMEANEDRATDTGCYGAGAFCIFGYNAHYCGVDRPNEPTIVVCSMFESGMRVFDIRDPLRPREIAYFNPGGNGGQPVAGSFRNGGTSGYTSARPRIVPERGEIWFTDQDKGFYVARFTNGVWPFRGAPSRPVTTNAGLPALLGCSKARAVKLRVRTTRARTATVYVNGKRRRTLRGRALRRAVLVALPKGRSTVRIVVHTRGGKRLTQTYRYTRCA